MTLVPFYWLKYRPYGVFTNFSFHYLLLQRLIQDSVLHFDIMCLPICEIQPFLSSSSFHLDSKESASTLFLCCHSLVKAKKLLQPDLKSIIRKNVLNKYWLFQVFQFMCYHPSSFKGDSRKTWVTIVWNLPAPQISLLTSSKGADAVYIPCHWTSQVAIFKSCVTLYDVATGPAHW